MLGGCENPNFPMQWCNLFRRVFVRVYRRFLTKTREECLHEGDIKKAPPGLTFGGRNDGKGSTEQMCLLHPNTGPERWLEFCEESGILMKEDLMEQMLMKDMALNVYAHRIKDYIAPGVKIHTVSEYQKMLKDQKKAETDINKKSSPIKEGLEQDEEDEDEEEEEEEEEPIDPTLPEDEQQKIREARKALKAAQKKEEALLKRLEGAGNIAGKRG